jgi:hypothetical protein
MVYPKHLTEVQGRKSFNRKPDTRATSALARSVSNSFCDWCGDERGPTPLLVADGYASSPAGCQAGGTGPELPVA